MQFVRKAKKTVPAFLPGIPLFWAALRFGCKCEGNSKSPGLL